MSEDIKKEEEGFLDKLKHKAEAVWDAAKEEAGELKDKAGHLKDAAAEKFHDLNGDSEKAADDAATKAANAKDELDKI